MPTANLRFVGFLFAVAISSTALGADHRSSHLANHACTGNCRFGHTLWPLNAVNLQDLDAVGYGTEILADSFAMSGAEELLVDEAASAHLSLAVISANGDKRFSSGVIRSGKVEYGPLSFEMNSTSREMPAEFRMLVDGEAAHPEAFASSSEWSAYETETEFGWTRTIQWNCPPLGRHSIQFEVRLNDRLVTSEPLWIEIVAPLKPEVIGVGSEENGTAPIKMGKIVSIYQDTLVVRFAMPPAAEMIMHRQGLEDIKGQTIDECCFQFDLKDLSVGRHGLRFSRVVGSGCAMTSERSDTLWIQYEPTSALHSLRNENAIRRRAIVDEIRRISASSRPVFDDKQMYSDVNSKFEPLKFNASSQLHHAVANPAVGFEELPPSNRVEETSITQVGSESSPSDVAPPQVEFGAGLSPQAPIPNPPGVQTSSAAPAATPATSESAAPTVAPPNPKATREAPAKGSSGGDNENSHFVSTANRADAEQVVAHQEVVFTGNDEPSQSLRIQAQRDEDRLGKFEDDLAIAESVWQTNKVVSHVIFDAPAYFAQNGYGPSGEEDARNGLVLLEGMELSTQASGHWELKIPYIKSATPLVLHLQIQFKTADGYWKPLTIQPICFKAGVPCIDPSDCNCARSTMNNGDQSVRCECSDGQPMMTVHGYSPILRREVGGFTDVRRRGSAVFGHGYSALEDRRSF